jgi:hypothetical protein
MINYYNQYNVQYLDHYHYRYVLQIIHKIHRIIDWRITTSTKRSNSMSFFARQKTFCFIVNKEKGINQGFYNIVQHLLSQKFFFLKFKILLFPTSWTKMNTKTSFFRQSYIFIIFVSRKLSHDMFF